MAENSDDDFTRPHLSAGLEWLNEPPPSDELLMTAHSRPAPVLASIVIAGSRWYRQSLNIALCIRNGTRLHCPIFAREVMGMKEDILHNSQTMNEGYPHQQGF